MYCNRHVLLTVSFVFIGSLTTQAALFSRVGRNAPAMSTCATFVSSNILRSNPFVNIRSLSTSTKMQVADVKRSETSRILNSVAAVQRSMLGRLNSKKHQRHEKSAIKYGVNFGIWSVLACWSIAATETIFDAIDKGDLEAVQKMISKDKKVLMQTIDTRKYPLKEITIEFMNSNHPVAFAVFKKDLAMVKLLLENGAQVNGALSIAAFYGLEEIADELFKHGAKVNNKYFPYSHGPMEYVIERAPLSMVNKFCDNAGPLLTTQEEGGIFSPPGMVNGFINHAIRVGRLEVVIQLLKRGSTFDGRELITAVRSKHDELLPALVALGANPTEALKFFLVTAHDYYDFRRMHSGGVAVNSESIKKIVELGGDATLVVNGVPLLHYIVDNAAYVEQSCGLVDIFIQNKVSVNVPDSNGFTALHKTSHPNIAQTLLNNKANVNIQDRQGKTALHHLIDKFNLVSAKAYQEARDHGGAKRYDCTGLEIFGNAYRIMEQYLATMDVMMSHGADLDIKDQNGKSPYEYGADKAQDGSSDFKIERLKNSLKQKTHEILLDKSKCHCG